MKDPHRLELLLKLGSKCEKCKETDYDILEIEHIEGNGYLERQWFKDNKRNMFEFYLNNFEENKQFIRIYCKNCNYKKKLENKETKNRVTFADFPVFNVPFNEVKDEQLVKVMEENPILWQTMLHQIKMLKELLNENTTTHPLLRKGKFR